MTEAENAQSSLAEGMVTSLAFFILMETTMSMFSLTMYSS